MNVIYYFSFVGISEAVRPLIVDWVGKVYMSEQDPNDPEVLTQILLSLKIQPGLMSFMSIALINSLPLDAENAQTRDYLIKTGRAISVQNV